MSKRITAGVLALLLGGLGIHKFYLGYNRAGIIMLIASCFTCGIASLVALVEGIMYLTKSDEEFNSIYVENQKEWF